MADMKQLLKSMIEKINIKANADDIPTKVSALENDAGYLSEIINTAFYLDLAYESGDASSMAFYSFDAEEVQNAFAAYLNGIAVFARFNITESESEKIIAPLMMVIESGDESVALFAVTGINPSTSTTQTATMVVSANTAILVMKPLITGEIDDTLSISGSVADAGAVGAALANKQPIGDYALRSELSDALPSVSASDAGKFLRVSADGAWAAESIPNAEEATF